MSTAHQVLLALASYNLKQEGQNKWRCNSPLRPGSDSHAFVITITDDEHGAYKDFVTEEKGSLYDLAKHLGIALPSAIPAHDTKRPFAGLDDYARAHGLTGEILTLYGWREVMYKGRPALEYPTATGRRWRFIDGKKGADFPKYVSEVGYERCWYGLDARLNDYLSAGSPLLLCNGEISTITAFNYGVPAFAMTGGEKAEIPANLVSQLKGYLAKYPNVEIIIAMDCDKTGRKSASGIESQFQREGFKARAVDLGLGTGGDLADFCMLYQQDALKELQKCKPLPAEKANPSKWHFATIDDVLNLPTIDWLVPRQIPSRGLTMIYGASGSYKSFFILDHALKLAQTGTNVLYIAAEGEFGYRQRLQGWINHYKVKPTSITFVLGSVDLFDNEDQTEFARVIEQYKPKIVVVDTFAMCSGVADENNARDMLQIVNGCKAMSKNLDAVIVIVHHTNAEGKKERGSKVFRNACDTIIRLSLDDDMVLVESQKTKDTAPFDAHRLAPLTVDLGYKNNIGENVTSLVLLPAEKVIKESTLTPLQLKVLDVLSVQPGASLAEIADTVECDSRGTISKVISTLNKKGFISIDGNNKHITQNGERALNGDESAPAPAGKPTNNRKSKKLFDDDNDTRSNYDYEDL